MPTIQAALTQVVELLEAEGVKAVIDLAEVEAPCAWVKLASVDWPTLSGEQSVLVEVHLLEAANEPLEYLPGLQALLEPTVTALGLPDGAATPQATITPHSPAPLPTLVLPYRIV